MQERPKNLDRKNQYKPLFYKNLLETKQYTSCNIGEDDYLHTDVWRSIRRSILKRDGFKCARCGSAINVVVHHITYPEAWGEENFEDLVTLCQNCHSYVHEEDIARKGANNL